MSESVACQQCNDLLSLETESCPNCGSTQRSHQIGLGHELGFHELLGSKQKRPGNSKPIHEELVGEELTGNTGRYSKKVRVIDRLNDHYQEKVTDPDTEEVLHECVEKLSEHFGRGAAKLAAHTFTHDQIATVAFSIWENTGRVHGKDRVHWDLAIEDLRRVAGGAPPRHS